MADSSRFVELYGPSPTDPIPTGVRIGPAIYLPAILGEDLGSRQLAEGYEGQLRLALDNARTLLERAGAGLDNVGHVTIFMRDMDGHAVVNRVWPEYFPDPADRPPHIYVPAPLPDRVMVQLRVVALPGERRRVLVIPGLSHQDPMSMGVRIGNLVFSSRLFATEPHTQRRGSTPEEQTEIVFGNVRALLEQAGASPANLDQVTVYAPDRSCAPLVEASLDQLLSGSETRPRVDHLEVNLPGGGIRLTITATVR